MRILYWTEAFWPYIGGLEVFSMRLLTALRARGHQILVVTCRGNLDLPDSDEYRGIPIRRFPFLDVLATRNLRRVSEIRRQVVELKRTFAPDVVHAKMTSVAPTTLFQLETSNPTLAPMLVTLQGAVNPAAADAETLHGSLLRRADWVTAVSLATLTEARDLVPEIADRSSVIYNSLDVPALAPTPPPHGSPRVLCLGRLSPEKGFDVAVRAFASVSRGFPDARLVVGGDGPERHLLEDMAAQLGLTDRVEFVGWVPPDRVPDLLNTASVVVVPSREEAFGIVALEAASMARPVVATRVGGLPEVVVHEQTGLLVEKDDPDALSEAVTSLLAHPDTAARMGDTARRRAIQDFRLERSVDAYVELYQHVTREVTHVPASDSLPHE
jgi:glycogen(starch) synthase